LLPTIALADMIGPGQWAVECFDDDHAATATGTRGRFVVGGGRGGAIAVGSIGRRWWHVECLPTAVELVGAVAVGEQALVADAMETGREDVEQEAAHALAHVEAHDLAVVTAVLAIVLPAEADMAFVDIKQAAVGDGDAMGVTGEIGQDLLGAGEGLLGIDDPFTFAQWREVSLPRVHVFELAEIGEELYLAGSVQGFEALQEQAPEQAREHADGKKEVAATGDPMLAVWRQSAL
jgi:hypothetical protein